MIYVDDRVGSVELVDYLPPQLTCVRRLEFGDFAFIGVGHNNETWLIGIERKKLRDLINSMVSGRFAGHQLIGLTNSYAVKYLVVEGVFRGDPTTGLLQIRRGRTWETLLQGSRTFKTREIWCYLNTLSIKAGVYVVMTYNINETSQWLLSMYNWWRKDWDKHKSHLQAKQPETVSFTRHSLVRRMASQIHGVGWERAKLISKRFDSVTQMTNATREDWIAIPGIGRGLSESIYNELHGIK